MHMAVESVEPSAPPGETPDTEEPRERVRQELDRANPPPARRMLARVPHVLGPLPALALGAIVLVAWQFTVASGAVNSFLLPLPADVLRSFWGSLRDGLLPSYAATTLVESVAGCALGAVVALPLGYAIARSRRIARAVQPYVAASQALPAVAIAPLIALWLGYDLPPVIALCALIVFFPMVITTTLGLRLLDRDVLDAARVDGAGRWALLWGIELPLALPSILAGLRTSLTLSITGAVVGEFVVGGKGLGELLLIERSYADSAGVFATLLMLALLAGTLYGAARLIEHRLSYVEA
jgi:NitT/TauT family transport system permease protein